MNCCLINSPNTPRRPGSTFHCLAPHPKPSYKGSKKGPEVKYETQSEVGLFRRRRIITTSGLLCTGGGSTPDQPIKNKEIHLQLGIPCGITNPEGSIFNLSSVPFFTKRVLAIQSQSGLAWWKILRRMECFVAALCPLVVPNCRLAQTSYRICHT